MLALLILKQHMRYFFWNKRRNPTSCAWF